MILSFEAWIFSGSPPDFIIRKERAGTNPFGHLFPFHIITIYSCRTLKYPFDQFEK